MIPEEYKDSLVQSGLEFMRTITKAYGTDEGLKLWDTIADTLDPDIKGQIFFAMLCGVESKVIVIRRWDNRLGNAYKVPMIKAVRQVTLCDLRVAKDLVDDFTDGVSLVMKLQIADGKMSRTECIKILQDTGLLV